MGSGEQANRAWGPGTAGQARVPTHPVSTAPGCWAHRLHSRRAAPSCQSLPSTCLQMPSCDRPLPLSQLKGTPGTSGLPRSPCQEPRKKRRLRAPCVVEGLRGSPCLRRSPAGCKRDMPTMSSLSATHAAPCSPSPPACSRPVSLTPQNTPRA